MKTLQYKTENNGNYDLITVYDEDGKVFTELEAGKFPDNNERFFTDEEEIQQYLDDNGYGDEEFEIRPLTPIEEIFDTLDEWDDLDDKKEILKFMEVEPTFTFGQYHWADLPYYSTIQRTKALAVESIAKYSKYDTDWNWLMKVVDKIDSLSYVRKDGKNVSFAVDIHQSNCGVECYLDGIGTGYVCSADGSDRLNAVYKAIVKFVKWYNNERD